MNTKISIAIAASLLALLPMHVSAQATMDRTSSSEIYVFKKGNPPAKVQNFISKYGDSGAKQQTHGYNSTVRDEGEYEVDASIYDKNGNNFSSLSYVARDVRVVYDRQFKQRISTGVMPHNFWGATKHIVGSALKYEDFVDGSYSFEGASSPSIDYAMFFDELPGMPGNSAFVIYHPTGNLDEMKWDRETDKSSAGYTFTVLITPTPPEWGVGPTEAYEMNVIGHFFDQCKNNCLR